ncbi:hypothetical protein EMCRGX_G025584 [Ephydatia muelleri]
MNVFRQCIRQLLAVPAIKSLSHAPSALHWSWLGSQTTSRRILPFTLSRSLKVLPSVSDVTTRSKTLQEVNGEIDKVPANKVFAVVHIGGRQFKITANDLIVINRIKADIGEKIVLNKVLLSGSENFSLVGTPLLSQEHVKVLATIVEHNKTAKVMVFKKKRRKMYKRTRGHRQDITVLRINDIELSPTLQ